MFTINLPNPFGSKDSKPVGKTDYTPLAVGLLIIILVVGGFVVFSNPKAHGKA
jgi:hypothetical protein